MAQRGQRLVVAGAKGGVGKTVLSIAIGLHAAAGGHRVIIADADFNLPTLAVNFDLFPELSLGAVLRGERSIEEVLIHAEGGVKLVPGDFDRGGLGRPDPGEMDELTVQLSRLSQLADLVVYDTTSASGQEVDIVLPLADRVLIVMTAEPAGLAGAFATLRAIKRHPELDGRAGLLVNQASNRPQAEAYADHLIQTADRALGLRIQPVGYVLADPHVREAVRSKQQFILRYPDAPASLAVRQLVAQLTSNNGPDAQHTQESSFWSGLLGR